MMSLNSFFWLSSSLTFGSVSSWTKPDIWFSGVRISCDMLRMNDVFMSVALSLSLCVSLFQRRYSLGVRPYWFSKRRMKVFSSLKPQRSATSSMVPLLSSFRRLTDCRMLISLTKLSVSPLVISSGRSFESSSCCSISWDMVATVALLRRLIFLL